MMVDEISRKDNIESLRQVMNYRPIFTAFITIFSVFATVLEGIGLTFLLPVIESARTGGMLSRNIF
jgi:subfamily B ATP-binding cassette protein MsbA